MLIGLVQAFPGRKVGTFWSQGFCCRKAAGLFWYQCCFGPTLPGLLGVTKGHCSISRSSFHKTSSKLREVTRDKQVSSGVTQGQTQALKQPVGSSKCCPIWDPVLKFAQRSAKVATATKSRHHKSSCWIQLNIQFSVVGQTESLIVMHLLFNVFPIGNHLLFTCYLGYFHISLVPQHVKAMCKADVITFGSMTCASHKMTALIK